MELIRNFIIGAEQSNAGPGLLTNVLLVSSNPQKGSGSATNYAIRMARIKQFK